MSNRVSIVTGAARGIGKAVSLALAEEGGKIILVDIAAEELKKVRKEVEKRGSEALLIKADLSNLKDIERIVQTTVKKFKRIDLLVNNAGLCSRSSISDTSESEWDRLMKVNLK